MKRKSTAGGFGLFATAVPPVSARPGAGDEVARELAATVRDLRTVTVLNALRGGGGTAVPTGDIPPANSLGEAVQAATGIAALHQGAAQTAMQHAQAAEQRADRLAKESGAQAEAARAEGMTFAQMMLNMQQTMMTALMTAKEQTHTALLDAANKASEMRLQELGGKIEGLIGEFKTALTSKEQTITKLQADLTEVRSQGTLEQKLMEELQTNGLGGWAAAYFGISPGGGTPEPKAIYETTMAQVLAETHAAEARHKIVELKAGSERKAQTTELTHQLISQGVNLLGELRHVLPGVFSGRQGGGWQGPQGAPSGFEPPPAAAEQEEGYAREVGGFGAE